MSNPPPSTEQALRSLLHAAKCVLNDDPLAEAYLQNAITAAEAALAAKEKPEPIFDPTLPLGLTKAELDARYLEFHNKVSREWEETYGTKWPYGPAI